MPRFDGADISHHQDDAGPIDWPTLRAASLGAWVATKATQSTTYVDPTCDTHRAHMSAQGFTHRGFYHWLSHITSPTVQAAHYLDCVGTLHVGEFVMLDAEEGGITAAMVLEWLHAVEAVTRRPASVYTGAYVAGGTIWQSTQIRTSPWGDRPMHLAAYTSEEKAKKLPGVAAYPWSAWQYSSNGPVPGVTGRCDMNRIDIPAHYDVACGLTFPPPNPQPEVDMELRLITLADSDAQFLAETTTDGRTYNVRWVGTPALSAMRDAHKGAATSAGKVFVQPQSVGWLINTCLTGPLPVGDPRHTWTGAEFAAVDASGTVDQVAREMADHANNEASHANEAITRIGSTISDIRMGGQRIADAGGH